MNRPLHAWTCHHVVLPLPPGHRFPAPKAAMLHDRLLAESVLDPAHVHRSEPAPDAWLTLAHEPAYVARMERGEMERDEARRLGLPWSPALVARARAATYGTVMAAFAALEHGIAGNLAGGSHHAHRDRAEAYCVFNDIVVAIAVLRTHGHAARPFVLDLDVHQGDGTARMCAGDPSVFTCSLHAASNHPARKALSTLDVPLPDRAGDDDYLAALEAHVPDALERHAPDLVIVQAGVDGLAADRLGRLALTHAGLAERDRRVLAWCERLDLPVVLTLGGGYGEPLEASVEAHAAVWRAARAARDRRAERRDGAFLPPVM